jgi:ATP-dependent Clp protease, protease subunit
VAREILRMRSQLEELLAQHTGQPLDRIHRDIDRDKIMTAEEAKEYGVVDVVLPSRKKSLAAA